jgi:hypothetical protein
MSNSSKKTGKQPIPTFGNNVNTSNYWVRLGSQGTSWITQNVLSKTFTNTEEECAKNCYDKPLCTKYTWNGQNTSCDLIDSSGKWNKITNLNNWYSRSSYAGYIVPLIPRPITPQVTQNFENVEKYENNDYAPLLIFIILLLAVILCLKYN